MKRLLTKLVAPALAAILAAGVFIQMDAYAAQADTSVYHRAVELEVLAIPVRIGPWEGVQSPIPPAAGKLLRPNAIFARQYRNAETGQWANLIFIHCKDSRDMSGHYPPNCYPGNGWKQGGPADISEMRVWKGKVPIAAYTFSRADGNRVRTTVVYNTFILPTTGYVTSMEEVRAASGDYLSRPYGAAQVQVMIDAATPVEQREQILREMLEPLAPVVELLHVRNTGERDHE